MIVVRKRLISAHAPLETSIAPPTMRQRSHRVTYDYNECRKSMSDLTRCLIFKQARLYTMSRGPLDSFYTSTTTTVQPLECSLQASRVFIIQNLFKIDSLIEVFITLGDRRSQANRYLASLFIIFAVCCPDGNPLDTPLKPPRCSACLRWYLYICVTEPALSAFICT